jgi:arabinan endo-1,5-alpha-L-arabinosidase
MLFALLVAPAFAQDAKVIPVNGDVQGIHDPSIMKDKDTWYVFSTQTGPPSQGELPIHCSSDLHEWKACGSVFPSIPQWIKEKSPNTKNLWAPDISYFNGLYHLYYAYSAFGVNTSGIALLTNKTLDPKSPDFHWNDEGLVVESKNADNFNAIDPNLIQDGNGGAWLAFGSFWGGIMMRKIDPKTGKLATDDPKTYALATRSKPDNAVPAKPGLPPDWEAIEAPFIIHHDGYFYLFVSYDLCCRGTKSTYKIAVGRAKAVTGPYEDDHGADMKKGGGKVLLVGNQRWLGPGGQSAYVGKDGDLLVFHAYDAKSGKPSLQISSIGWQNGWPTLALEDGAAK